MKLSSSVKYHLNGFKPTIIIFYSIVLAMIALSIFLSSILGGESRFGGFAASSMIFLFVIGICSFYTEFRMLNQNGISRYEQWKSFLISSLIIACIMSAIDILLFLLVSVLINTESLLVTLSASYLSRINNNALNIFNAYLMQVLLYTLMLSVGYFVRLIYYRMNKFGVIIVSIGVPAFLFIGLPLIEAFLYYQTKSSLSGIIDFFAWTTSPYKSYGLPMFYLYFIALFTVIALLNKLLIKKAIIK